ncbi:Dynein light chain roadblock-type [Fasciola hepatica]|uniref:Dynein light chain roadblock n=1 Tax=Fasciola hepatica TaxID=6192 RepID=A0A4E0RD34_FASHE|nr:Dynein light chain roadblock-type [Fasciola hepatica]
MSEVEETLKRISSQKGVTGAIVGNSDGVAVRSNLDNNATVSYCGLIQQLTNKARAALRDLDPTNDLTFLRIRSKKNEIMVAPDRDYSLIVIQDAESESS